MVATTLSPGASITQLVFGAIGVLTAAFVISSPWSTFKTIRTTQQVGATKPYNYLAIVFNSAMWVVFGIPAIAKLVHEHHHAIADWLTVPLMLANGAGVIVELYYVIIFIRFAAGHRRWPVLSLILVVSVSMVVLMLLLFTGWSRTFVGYLAMFSGAAMYVMPVYTTYRAYKNNAIHQISRFQAGASFVNGVVWTIYSCIGGFHAFVFVPNLMAVICAGGQLCVWYILRARAHDLEAGPSNIVGASVAAPGNGGASVAAAGGGGASVAAGGGGDDPAAPRDTVAAGPLLVAQDTEGAGASVTAAGGGSRNPAAGGEEPTMGVPSRGHRVNFVLGPPLEPTAVQVAAAAGALQDAQGMGEAGAPNKLEHVPAAEKSEELVVEKQVQGQEPSDNPGHEGDDSDKPDDDPGKPSDDGSGDDVDEPGGGSGDEPGTGAMVE